eukprot:scaffold24856_cov19-Tisochrysis_lutea.AAC.1
MYHIRPGCRGCRVARWGKAWEAHFPKNFIATDNLLLTKALVNAPIVGLDTKRSGNSSRQQ